MPALFRFCQVIPQEPFRRHVPWEEGSEQPRNNPVRNERARFRHTRALGRAAPPTSSLRGEFFAPREKSGADRFAECAARFLARFREIGPAWCRCATGRSAWRLLDGLADELGPCHSTLRGRQSLVGVGLDEPCDVPVLRGLDDQHRNRHHADPHAQDQAQEQRGNDGEQKVHVDNFSRELWICCGACC